jgi:hypothetical protein
MNNVVCDIETYWNYFLIAFKRLNDGKIKTFELTEDSDPLPVADIKRILDNNRIITYNGNNYDIPMIYLALEGVDNAALKRASDKIIKGNVRWWQVEDTLGIRIPKIDHIDLIEPQPSPFASLKTLNGRLHGRTMQDLPYDPDKHLTVEEMANLKAYCGNDLEATELLFNAIREPLELRSALGNQYGQDFRSKSDAQIGERIVKSRAEELAGRRLQRVETPPGTTFKYEVPDFIKFDSQVMKDVLERVRETEFKVGKSGKVDLPKWLTERKIKIGESAYQMGIGGLHSTEARRGLRSTDERVLIDADVASQYPSIILKLGLYPKSLGKHFLEVYGQIRQERLQAKREGDKIADKGLKIALNGVYGKLGSSFSIVYAPHLLIATTLTGQLSLLMLIEKAEAAGISVVSGNTDGVVFNCPRELAGEADGDRRTDSVLAQVCEQWERDTGFNLEFAEYEALYNEHVNSYFAFKPDGEVKQKGARANPWGEGGSMREMLMKNPQFTILTEAVIARMRDGIPVEETIRGCEDVRKFVRVINATGGATWRGEYLGKVVRYIWSTDGDPIIKVKPNAKGTRPKVPDTDGGRPMMTLEDQVPADIDYSAYIERAKRILIDFGFNPAPEEFKRSRKKPTLQTVAAWSLWV